VSDYQYREPPNGHEVWSQLSVGGSDITSGGMSYEQKACLWDFRPGSEYRCTRERHADGWHVASEDGRIVAYTHVPRRES
jgi:hypothetical protein